MIGYIPIAIYLILIPILLITQRRLQPSRVWWILSIANLVVLSLLMLSLLLPVDLDLPGVVVPIMGVLNSEYILVELCLVALLLLTLSIGRENIADRWKLIQISRLLSIVIFLLATQVLAPFFLNVLGILYLILYSIETFSPAEKDRDFSQLVRPLIFLAISDFLFFISTLPDLMPTSFGLETDVVRYCLAGAGVASIGLRIIAVLNVNRDDHVLSLKYDHRFPSFLQALLAYISFEWLMSVYELPGNLVVILMLAIVVAIYIAMFNKRKGNHNAEILLILITGSFVCCASGIGSIVAVTTLLVMTIYQDLVIDLFKPFRMIYFGSWVAIFALLTNRLYDSLENESPVLRIAIMVVVIMTIVSLMIRKIRIWLQENNPGHSFVYQAQNLALLIVFPVFGLIDPGYWTGFALLNYPIWQTIFVFIAGLSLGILPAFLNETIIEQINLIFNRGWKLVRDSLQRILEKIDYYGARLFGLLGDITNSGNSIYFFIGIFIFILIVVFQI